MTVDVRDRAVQYPSRYKLVLVEGTTDTYDFIPVPGTVAEAGTPINRALFEDLNGDIAEAYNLADGRARIITGSYTGTGTYGEDNPNLLTFSFTPKLIIIQNYIESLGTGKCRGGIFIRDSQTGMVYHYAYSTSTMPISKVTITWGTNNIQWYGNDVSDQLNNEGIDYRYIAIG